MRSEKPVHRDEEADSHNVAAAVKLWQLVRILVDEPSLDHVDVECSIGQLLNEKAHQSQLQDRGQELVRAFEHHGSESYRDRHQKHRAADRERVDVSVLEKLVRARQGLNVL